MAIWIYLITILIINVKRTLKAILEFSIRRFAVDILKNND